MRKPSAGARRESAALAFGRLLVALAVIAGAAARARAQVPMSRLAWVFPPALRAGATNEVEVVGEDLEGPANLVFSNPRIRTWPKDGSTTRFLVAAPPDLESAAVDVRYSGRFGVSNPRGMVVAPGDLQMAPADPGAFAAPAAAPVETTIAGRASANADRWFRFDARGGQRLGVWAWTREIDSRLSPVLTIFDGRHHELANARRGWLDFEPASDGPYWLRLHDLTYRGGDEFFFLLRITTAPWIAFGLPKDGAPDRVVWYGRRLPGGKSSGFPWLDGFPLEQLEGALASTGWSPGSVGAPRPRLSGFGLGALASAAPGRATPWACAPAPPMQGGGATVAAGGSVAVSPPCTVAGFFGDLRRPSVVRFNARKGDRWRVEVFSDRLGFHALPRLMPQRVLAATGSDAERLEDLSEIRPPGTSGGDKDWDVSSRDPGGVWEAPGDGAFAFALRDRFHADQDGWRNPFFFRIAAVRPEFRLAVWPEPAPVADNNDRKVRVAAFVLRRGETAALRVAVLRSPGFDGPVSVSARGMPRGVWGEPLEIAEGQARGRLLITAASDATATFGSFEIIGEAVGGSPKVSAVAGAIQWSVADREDEFASVRPAGPPFVSVIDTESAPLGLYPATGEVDVEADGVCRIIFTATRGSEQAGPVKFRLKGHPALEKSREFELDPKATNLAVEIKLTEVPIPVGERRLWLEGRATVKYRDRPEAVAAAEEEVKKAAAAAAGPGDKPALAARLKMAEERKKTVEERARPRDSLVQVYSAPFTLRVRGKPNDPGLKH